MLTVQRDCTYRVGPHLFRCGDLEQDDWKRLIGLLDAACPLVYSDPPWNAANARYWRTHAEILSGPVNWPSFCEVWCRAVAFVNPCVVYTEQSAVGYHATVMIQAAKRCGLPSLHSTYTVRYGAPVNTSDHIVECRRPNLLCRFATDGWDGDPTGLAGEEMTRHVFTHEPLVARSKGLFVADPCVGKGMTARMAHRFGLRCVGLELNPCRLQVTIDWLVKQGLTVAKC